MTLDQGMSFGLLGLIIVLFAWGRWRYDLVALFGLLVAVGTGLVAPDVAFAGFAHPAVITVAAVLIISRGLQNAGIVDAVVALIAPLRGRETLQIAAQSTVIAVLSGFMNNVGALALMLPVALRNAYRDGYSPAKSLMPLAFASLLGGLVTLIGTPPNIIISAYRKTEIGAPFGMFDFAPVGLAVAVAGLAFLVLGARWLLPKGEAGPAGGEVFNITDYVAEATVPEDAKAIGMTVQELEALAEDVIVIGIIHDKTSRLVPAGARRIGAGDLLLLRGSASNIKSLIDASDLDLAENREIAKEELKSSDIDVFEVVVTAGSRLVGRTVAAARLRAIYSMNLLALARQGKEIRQRLGAVSIRPGDVLLLQGPASSMSDSLSELQLLPLANRSLEIGNDRRLAVAGGAFILAIIAVVAGFVPVHIAFCAVALFYALTAIVKPTEMYRAIEWPVIVLLGALIPLGGALEATGGTALVADGVVWLTGGLGSAWVVAILLIVTMFVSDIINNNATAVLMAPIALTLADRLGANPDQFLMAVAVGASCAFLTPVGHQSNTLVMEPGGYRFGDYWRVGLPLELVIVVVAVPAILIVWS